MLQPSREFFCGADTLCHEPWTDDVSILDFDGVAAQCGTAGFVYVPKLAQKSRDCAHIERPKNPQPALFQGFNIEVSSG